MDQEVPRIEAVKVEAPWKLRIRWRGKRTTDLVDLIGWIHTGGDVLVPLRASDIFSRAAVASYGTAVAWDDDDLAIDALHLKKLADEQRPISNDYVRVWQMSVKLSNNEAADMLGVTVSTWNTYKVSARVPQSVAIVLRCALRDPLVMQAHFRPRTAGRPKKETGKLA